jgi:hypothetical protein
MCPGSATIDEKRFLFSIRKDEDQKYHSRNQYIQPSECSDLGRNNFVQQKGDVKAVLDDPGQELGIREKKAKDHKHLIDILQFHADHSWNDGMQIYSLILL